MNNYLTIGEVAKLQNISRQTLIFYDTIGLFKPEYVDDNNGYRYYSLKQLDYLDTICILKKMGLTLSSIQQFMQAYTIDDSISALENQVDSITKKINDLTLLKNRVDHRLQQLQNCKPIFKNKLQPIVIETSDKIAIFTQPVQPPYSLEQVSLATKQCYVNSAKLHLPIYLQSGAIIPLDNLYNEKYTQALHAFLLIDTNTKNSNVIQLPKHKCVSTYHIGNYASIGTTYKRILDYSLTNNITLTSPAYEFAIHDYLSTGNEDEYITKIIIYCD